MTSAIYVLPREKELMMYSTRGDCPPAHSLLTTEPAPQVPLTLERSMAHNYPGFVPREHVKGSDLFLVHFERIN